MKPDVIEEFAQELLEELGFSTDLDKYEELKKTIIERVNARVFLDILNSLTPEQAELIANDISGEKPDPDLFFAKIADATPHLQAVIAQSLANIRLEII